MHRQAATNPGTPPRIRRFIALLEFPPPDDSNNHAADAHIDQAGRADALDAQLPRVPLGHRPVRTGGRTPLKAAIAKPKLLKFLRKPKNVPRSPLLPLRDRHAK